MSIEYKFYLDKIYVKQYDNCPNSVARVHWICVIKRNNAKIFAGGTTDLSPPNKESFIDISTLEAQKVIDWVIQENGGQQWIDTFISNHEEQLKRAEMEAELEAWNIPLVNPIRFDPKNV